METSGKISGKTLGAEIAEISRTEIFPETDNPEFPSVKSFPERKDGNFPGGNFSRHRKIGNPRRVLSQSGCCIPHHAWLQLMQINCGKCFEGGGDGATLFHGLELEILLRLGRDYDDGDS
ncbi:hypothetical protein [Mobiluncus mulieris]|uniref:hypothetical protein n=1 Tax=Mobiluncus mulieris TaxID=2052 RepID=UPI00067F9AE1|nr:hypothetical protein [Mobiluncus mulieris]MCU9975607.1 hypothetical protein [Mobiluncus mulieris]MCU9994935.1 hypothetical protein [Mobiluncus mulieris]MCV0011248.1 hypothetical protein [Mobiluncus mulieris]NMW81900.1 hypothetical protein [Mobiluncus mulieris]NMW90761.1 hypothetical protein [Mobiluncus mulieris]